MKNYEKRGEFGILSTQKGRFQITAFGKTVLDICAESVKAHKSMLAVTVNGYYDIYLLEYDTKLSCYGE